MLSLCFKCIKQPLRLSGRWKGSQWLLLWASGGSDTGRDRIWHGGFRSTTAPSAARILWDMCPVVCARVCRNAFFVATFVYLFVNMAVRSRSPHIWSKPRRLKDRVQCLSWADPGLQPYPLSGTAAEMANSVQECLSNRDTGARQQQNTHVFLLFIFLVLLSPTFCLDFAFWRFCSSRLSQWVHVFKWPKFLV